MFKSFRFWCLAAAALSLLTTLLHVVSGGPQFHDTALVGPLPNTWKAAFSTVWHEITALLFLNGIFLVAAGLTWTRNTMVLLLVFSLNAAFAILFLSYGLLRLGSPWPLPQWILFATISIFTGLALWLPGQHPETAETSRDQSAFTALPKATFADTFVTRTLDHHTALAATLHVFNVSPSWVTRLLALRNRIVPVFGLKAEAPTAPPHYIGMFPVISETKDRVVLGFDDRHLDFRIVVNLLCEEGTVRLTTLVQPHNIWGRLYLAVVKPFHRLIVPTMLSRAAIRCQGTR